MTLKTLYLGNKIANHTTIINAHSRPIGVENSGNPNLQQQKQEQPMYEHTFMDLSHEKQGPPTTLKFTI